jgi:hypothetical protein
LIPSDTERERNHLRVSLGVKNRPLSTATASSAATPIAPSPRLTPVLSSATDSVCKAAPPIVSTHTTVRHRRRRALNLLAASAQLAC